MSGTKIYREQEFTCVHISYLESSISSCGPADLYLNSNNELQYIEINNTQYDIPNLPTRVLRCFDIEKKSAYWLVVTQNNLVFYVECNLHTGKAEKCKQLHGIGFGPWTTASKLDVDADFFSKSAYDNIINNYNDYLKLVNLESFVKELVNDLIRPADDVHRVRLDGEGEDFFLEKTRAFQKKCTEKYIALVRKELSDILIQHGESRVTGLKQALIDYLQMHWERIKMTNMSYTALPRHPVTLSLISLAEYLARMTEKDAISYLLPGIYTISCSDDFSDLTEISLTDVVSEYIIATNGKYLIPVKLLLQAFSITQEFINPYFSYEDSEFQNSFTTNDDLQRLYLHSEQTQHLMNVSKQLLLEAMDQGTILGQLNNLIVVLKSSDAHDGLGTQTNVANIAYFSIMSFMQYYFRLNAIGIYRSNFIPSVESLPSALDIGYVVVDQPENAGLYCVSRYNSEVERICDGTRLMRYPLNLLATNHLPQDLSTDCPTLVRVMSDPKNQYHIYGKHADGNWGFTKINTTAQFRLPLNIDWSIKLDSIVTLALGNVPEDLYIAIDNFNAHKSDATVVECLSTISNESVQICNLEHLQLIQTHTAHFILQEFKNIPVNIRQQINDLWAFIQNPGINLSATETMETCAGTIREKLEKYVQQVSEKEWSTIQLPLAEREIHYHRNKEEMQLAQINLQESLNEKRYYGADVLFPTSKLLKTLNINLEIQNLEDLKWICRFPEQSIKDFLLDKSNPEILVTFEGLSELILTAPARSYSTLWKLFGNSINIEQINKLIRFLDSKERIKAFLTIDDVFANINYNSCFYSKLFDQLSEEQFRLILEFVQNKLNMTLINNGRELELLLRYGLDKKLRGVLLEYLKDQISTMFTSLDEVLHVMDVLTPPNKEMSPNNEMLLKIISKQLINLIENSRNFKLFIVSPASRHYCKFFLGLFKDKLDKLVKFIPNFEVFKDIFFHLNEEARFILLDLLKDNLASIIQKLHQLSEILHPSSLDIKKEILKILENSLPMMIHKKDELDAFLVWELEYDRLNQNIVLEAIKGKLREVVSITSRYTYRPSRGDFENVQRNITAKLQHCNYRLFSKYRVQHINTGSLESKLKKYIDTLNSETILSSLRYLHTSRSIKLAAATYALLIVQNNDAHLVKLKKSVTMPTPQDLSVNYKNKYLLVTGLNNNAITLYYVDYQANKTKVKVSKIPELLAYFNENQDCHKSYQDISTDLSDFVMEKLPTDIQLEVLQKGLLGDIIIESEKKSDIIPLLNR